MRRFMPDVVVSCALDSIFARRVAMISSLKALLKRIGRHGFLNSLAAAIPRMV